MLRYEIIFTDHAIERAKELNISKRAIKGLLLEAKRQPISPMRELYKIAKYGFRKQGRIYYYLRKGTSRYPRLLFTVEHQNSSMIVITITKK